MKLNRIKRRNKGNLVLELTPLIDVVFLLLIFFMVATTFEDINSGIKIDLPQSTIKEIKDIKEIQVAVTKNKEILLNFKDGNKREEKKVSKANLKKALGDMLNKSQERNVLISADKNIDYGYIVEIMTISKEAGALSLDIDTTANN